MAYKGSTCTYYARLTLLEGSRAGGLRLQVEELTGLGV